MTTANNSSPTGKKKPVQSSVWDISRQAFDLMHSNQIDPTPKNYTSWYHYVQGKDETISRLISEHIQHGRKFDDRFNQHVYQECLSTPTMGTSADKVVKETHDSMNSTLEIISDILSAADTHNDDIMNKLEQIKSQAYKDPESVVELLISAASEMKDNTSAMSEQLRQSRAEVEQLQHNLDTVTQEAERDFLTGLYNRQALDRASRKLMREAKADNTPLSVLMIDIDHFKDYNNQHGHLIGDEVLKIVSHLLGSLVRGQDVAARYGGDEFIVLLPDTPPQGALRVAESLRTAVAGKKLHHRATGQTFGSITVSIGASLLREEDDFDLIVHRADRALYAAKGEGRNCARAVLDLPDNTANLNGGVIN